MITYKEKDRLMAHILSKNDIDLIINYDEAFPDREVSKNEFFLIINQFLEMGLLYKAKSMSSGLCFIGVTANLHDLFVHGGFKAKEELLKANLEKLGYELDELAKSTDPEVVSRVKTITGIAASISTVLGLFSK